MQEQKCVLTARPPSASHGWQLVPADALKWQVESLTVTRS